MELEARNLPDNAIHMTISLWLIHMPYKWARRLRPWKAPGAIVVKLFPLTILNNSLNEKQTTKRMQALPHRNVRLVSGAKDPFSKETIELRDKSL